MTAADGTSPRSLLRIYVNDHRAGAVGGVALCRRMAKEQQGTPAGRELTSIAAEINDDHLILESFALEHGIHANVVKQWIAALFERLGVLKLNGSLVRRSPLSSLLELEALLAGVDAKRSLWRSLRSAGCTGVDLDRLVERATRQRARLHALHEAAARAALSGAHVS